MFDIVCLSHLRWNHVYQRPQHIMTRFARRGRVFFVEEPCEDGDSPYLDVTNPCHGVQVLSVHVPAGIDTRELDAIQQSLVSNFLKGQGLDSAVLWYYTPMAIPWTPDVVPSCVVYDCMDELSAFKDASSELRRYERELLREADLVFTGGESLYEAKRGSHASVHCFPSSVEVQHFARARETVPDPPDQGGIPRPRLGFFGVLDERLDLKLLADVASLRPHWHLVMVGPVSKIEESALPQLPNIHYLGAKKYAELPDYVAGWDVAILPFARNESTRFISPTKTPEYLAAGKPVVSTSIRDVIRPYGEKGLVEIADTPEEFVSAVERILSDNTSARQEAADAHLRTMSWDQTWAQMNALIEKTQRVPLASRGPATKEAAYV